MALIDNQVVPPAASETDRRLSVHTLGEFLYCPRAGLQAYENQGREEDIDTVVHLNFLPPYELAELRQQLDWQVRQTLWLLGVLVVVVVLSVLLITFVSPLFAVAGVAAGLVGLWMSNKQLPRLWTLYRAHRQSIRAGRRSPKEALEGPERINWWALLNDGFDSVHCGRLFDDATQLGGRPWRVLRRGGLRIPVIRLRETKEQLFDSHFAKVAAHCHLLHVSEPTTLSPYGIVLFGDSLDGFAIPNDPHTRKHFHQALVDCRVIILNADRPEDEPPAPEPSVRSKLCGLCPWGCPLVYRPGATESQKHEEKLKPRTVRGRDQRDYHSHCGDRFDWVPPHAKAKDKGLTLG